MQRVTNAARLRYVVAVVRSPRHVGRLFGPNINLGAYLSLAVCFVVACTACVHRSECIAPAEDRGGRCVIVGEDASLDAGAGDARSDTLVALDSGTDGLLADTNTLDTSGPRGEFELRAAAVGSDHLCVIGDWSTGLQGRVYCQGEESQGQLGVMSPTDGWNEVDLPAPARDISTRSGTTCAIAGEGGGSRAFCWGRNESMQVNGVETQNPALPTEVDGRRGWQAIVVGNRQVCAIVDGGMVLCWGERHMEAGVAPELLHDTHDVLLASIETIALADGWGCFAAASNRVSCWGDPLRFSREGGYEIGDATVQTWPARALSATTDHMCLFPAASPSTTACLGSNTTTQIANSGGPFGLPENVGGNDIQVLAGAGFTCRVQTNGTVLCRGENRDGQLGLGHEFADLGFFPVYELTDARSLVTSGDGRTCAIRAGGRLLVGEIPMAINQSRSTCPWIASSRQLGLEVTSPRL